MVGPAPDGEAAPAIPPADLADRIAAGRVEPNEDGSADIVLMEDEPAKPEVEWFGNLAEHIDAPILHSIAYDVLEGIEADEESNEEYFAEIEAIIRLLGLKPEARESADKPFAHASDAIHPMMLEAVVRFVANGRAEMLPASGPARSKIMATPSQPLEDVAQRRERYINYHLTIEDREWCADYERGLFWLALYGSIFRKVYRDPVSRRVLSRFLTPHNLLVSYDAPSLDRAARFTHIDEISADEALRRKLAGYYIDGMEILPGDASDTPGAAVMAAAENRTRSSRNEDAPQTHYHCHCWHTLAGTGFEHKGEDGEPDGLPLPVIVTVDKQTNEVLRIERDWLEGDALCERRDSVTHYLFHPGLGFYGIGLGQLMRGSAAQASDLWRIAIDTFTLNSFPGGIVSDAVKSEDNAISPGPGEWQRMNTQGRPIREMFMSMGEVYKDLPVSWGPIFQSAVEQGQRLGMTTEIATGEGRQDAPVGTTLALIEQAIRPEAAVFKRLHAGMSQELRLFCAEFAKDPAAEYPYVVDGQKHVAMGADFADAADIVPVSDPNQPTQMQRVAAAEAIYKVAQTSGGMMDARAALSDLLRTMGKSPQEIQALMPQAPQGQPMDVASEFAMALKQMPLKVGPTQDHAAHAQAHIAQMQTPGLPPPVAAALLAHVGEHVAAGYWLMAAQAAAAQGIQIPPPGQPMPPEMEAAMARAVAQQSTQIVAGLKQALGGAEDGNAPDPLKAQELALKARELEFKVHDADRLAEQSSRQEMGEVIRAKQEAADNAAEREARLAEKRLDVQAEIIKAQAQMARRVGPASGPIT